MTRLPPRKYPLRGLPDPAECLSLLSRIRHGIAAQAVDWREASEHGYVYRLPLFLDGPNVALTWDVPIVGVVPTGETLAATWVAHDRTFEGGERSGEVLIADLGSRDERTPFATPARLHRTLTRIGREGDEAKWLLTEMWRPYVANLLHLASVNVGLEIGVATVESEKAGVIDDGEMDELRDRYMLGTEGGESLFHRLIVRASSDLRAGVGDRVAYIARNSLRDAEDAVRRQIGDPHTGRLVRRVWSTLGPGATFDDLRAEFAKSYPKLAGLGPSRAYAALTAGQSANHSAVNEADHIFALGLSGAPTHVEEHSDDAEEVSE